MTLAAVGGLLSLPHADALRKFFLIIHLANEPGITLA
jgi:hypothetical protein